MSNIAEKVNAAKETIKHTVENVQQIVKNNEVTKTIKINYQNIALVLGFSLLLFNIVYKFFYRKSVDVKTKEDVKRVVKTHISSFILDFIILLCLSVFVYDYIINGKYIPCETAPTLIQNVPRSLFF
jgi:heme/copper-type cytochrome/quinol oxidase subunit 2